MKGALTTRIPWFRRTLALAVALCLAVVLVACKDDPLDNRLERTEALIELLETHRDDPDTLLAELESFAQEHEGEWHAETEALAEMDEADRIRLTSVHDQRMETTYIELYDATLYIQDHLGREDPAKLRRFLELMHSLGEP